MTVMRSWNCHFRGHLIITPALAMFTHMLRLEKGLFNSMCLCHNLNLCAVYQQPLTSLRMFWPGLGLFSLQDWAWCSDQEPADETQVLGTSGQPLCPQGGRLWGNLDCQHLPILPKSFFYSTQHNKDTAQNNFIIKINIFKKCLWIICFSVEQYKLSW